MPAPRQLQRDAALALALVAPAAAEQGHPRVYGGIPFTGYDCVIELDRLDNRVYPPTHEDVCVSPGHVVFTGVKPDEGARWFFDYVATQISQAERGSP